MVSFKTAADLFGDRALSTQHTRGFADPDSYKIVSIRLRRAEFECFSKRAQELGLTHSLALRIAARRIAGFLEADSETRQALRDISGSIAEISLDLREIRRSCELNETVDTRALTESFANFARAYLKLDHVLETILNVSQRRSDGQTRLKAAAGINSAR